MRRMVTLLVALALAATACSGEGGETQSSGQDDTLVFYDAGPNDSLDPATTVNDNSFAQAPLLAVYDRLIHFDPKGNLVPGLATEWGFTDDRLTEFELTVRKGVTFHDGEPLNAEAVVTNLQRIKKLGGRAGDTVGALGKALDEAKATGKYHVHISLKHPYSGLPYALATQPGMMISPAAIAKANGAMGLEIEPVGAGPYKVIEVVPNQFSRLARYKGYWGGGIQRRPAEFEIHYIPESQTRLNAVRSGQVDVSLIQPDQRPHADSAGLKVQVNEKLSVWTHYINTSGPLSDVRVRKALNFALDRQAIAKNLMYGTGEPTNQLFPPGYSTYVEELGNKYTYDPAKAKRLLAEAGYADGLKLEFLLLNKDNYKKMFGAIQQMWAKVGVTLNVRTVDVSQFSLFTSGEFGDLMLARWGGRADPLQTLQIVVGPNGTYTPGGTVGPQLERALEKAAMLKPTTPERVQAIKEANRIAIEKAAAIPVVTRSNVYAYQPGCIRGLDSFVALGSDDWRNVILGSNCG